MYRPAVAGAVIPATEKLAVEAAWLAAPMSAPMPLPVGAAALAAWIRYSAAVTFCPPVAVSSPLARTMIVPLLITLGVRTTVVAGPAVSRHWSQGQRGGITIGDVLIDVPADRSPDGWGESLAELEQRAHGRSYCLITRETDVNLALELAMEQGLRRGALT